MSNVIRAILADGKVSLQFAESVFQYDQGRVIEFVGFDLPPTFEMDFSNGPNMPSKTQIGADNQIEIPYEFTVSGAPVYCYLMRNGQGYTITDKPTLIIPLLPRSARTNEQPAPEPQSVIDQAIAALNGAVESAETAIEHYPQIVDGTWRVWNVTAEEWVDTGIQGTGADGVGISSIVKTGTTGLVDTYTITFTSGDKAYFTVTNGENGDPGVSPILIVSEITGGHRLTIVDADHPDGQAVDILNGENGDDGRGIVSVAKIGTSGLVDTYQITYTSGEPTTFTITNGAPGADGVSPAVTIASITGGHSVTITDKDHPSGQSFDVMDGTDGQDGQDGSPGVGVPSGGQTGMVLKKASGTDYDAEWADQNPVVSVSGSTPSITAMAGVRYVCGECSTLAVQAPASGCIDVVFTSGSTPTVLTVTSAKSGVAAIKWANSWDETCEANTVYEINILDGEYGVVAAWT